MYTVVQPTHVFDCPILFEDMRVILRECDIEPFPIRSTDRMIFAKTKELLKSKISSIDPYVEKICVLPPSIRIERAIEFLYRFYFLVSTKKRKKNYCFDVSFGGMDWLNRDESEQFERFIRPFRDTTLESRSTDEYSISIDLLYMLTAFYLPSSIPVLQILREQFATLSTETFVSLDDFIEYQFEHHNPLSEQSKHYKKIPQYMRMLPYIKNPENNIWKRLIKAYIGSWLLPTGGCRLGWTDDLTPCVALTGIGLYLLGKRERVEHARIHNRPLLVQPTFDVFFTQPSPRAETLISRYAVRTGTVLGNVFHITPESIKHAAYIGIEVESILQELSALSSKPLPDNVVHEIKDWYGKLRSVSISEAIVIECPDMETAGVVKKALGKQAQVMGNTMVVCKSIKTRRTLITKLNKHGIFVDG